MPYMPPCYRNMMCEIQICQSEFREEESYERSDQIKIEFTIAYIFYCLVTKYETGQSGEWNATSHMPLHLSLIEKSELLLVFRIVFAKMYCGLL